MTSAAYAHSRIDLLIKIVDQHVDRLERMGHTIERMSEFITMQVDINQKLQAQIHNIDSRVGQLEGL